MLSTISLDTKFMFRGVEIQNVFSQRKLPAELNPCKLPVSQYRPQFLFSFGLISEKVSALVDILALHLSYPLTLSSLGRGELWKLEIASAAPRNDGKDYHQIELALQSSYGQKIFKP